MSSGSESDDDYVPEANPEKLSEEESADDETEAQYENEVQQKNKRKATQEPKANKKRRTRNCAEEVDEEPEKMAEEDLDPIEQKKKEDDLWAMFLDGTETKPKPKESKIEPPPEASKKVEKETKKDDSMSDRDKRIFEFAGETIVVENNVIKERIKTDAVPSTAAAAPLVRASTGGLSGLLGAINKKNKLSTLEKSKLDWTTYKQDEGIDEEIKSHNKGKQGYLERKDFLERADYRQYEIERDLRMGRRSNR